MWTEIGVFIIEVITENSFLSLVGKMKKEKEKKEFKKALSRHCFQTLKKYDDTSLDCDAFFRYIRTERFSNLLYRLFNTPYDGNSTSSLIEWFIKDSSNECSKCHKRELRGFIRDIDTIYKNYLHTIMEEDVSLSAFWSLLTITNRKFYQKIFENEENILKYLKSCFSPDKIYETPDLSAYHEHCIKEFSKISFSGIVGAETKTSKSIDELYVENNFIVLADFISDRIRQYIFQKHIRTKKQINELDDMNILIDNVGSLLKLSNRIVLIGGAGYGKSTTVNYVFCKYNDLVGHDILRIKLNLKDYVKELENNKDIFDCLLHEVTKRTPRSKQNNLDHILAQYIESGNTLIIFDELDEIPSESLREKARIEISNFVNLYHLNKYIITSREVGYLRNKFDESFLHVRICLFNDPQIKQYSESWYLQRTVEGEDDNSSFEEFYNRFSNEVEKSKCIELIRNPIILVLALIIFDASNTLPHKRVEFYKKCIETFLSAREEGKGAFPLSEQTRNILGNSATIPTIAFYRYEELSNNPEYRFTKAELIKFILRSLEVSEEAGWIGAVRSFTKYLIERTELIRETDENVFDFSHKTFGEYFLACYFANNTELGKLLGLLDQWIGDPNMDELARLVIEVIIQQNQKQQHEAVISMLFSTIIGLKSTAKEIYAREVYEINEAKVRDYSALLFSVVQNGMLIPKFVEKFYALLINSPELLWQRSPNASIRAFRHQPVSINIEEYIRLSSKKERDTNDSIGAIERYCYLCCSMAHDAQSLSSIKSLYLESHNITSKISYFLDFLLDLFSGGSFRMSLTKKVRKNSPELVRIVDIINKNEVLFNSSFIFLLVVYLLCLGSESMIYLTNEWLSKFSFCRNNNFQQFFSPRTLILLLHNTFVDEKWFIFNLISFVLCTGSSAFFLLDWPDKHREVIEEAPKQNTTKVSRKLVLENALCIKELFMKRNFNDFVGRIKSKNVYNSAFDLVYQTLFQTCEKYYLNNKPINNELSKEL